MRLNNRARPVGHTSSPQTYAAARRGPYTHSVAVVALAVWSQTRQAIALTTSRWETQDKNRGSALFQHQSAYRSRSARQCEGCSDMRRRRDGKSAFIPAYMAVAG